jgi:peroxiredoxin/predicted amidophosphoribosyltransferase
MQPKSNLPLGPNIILCPNCHAQKDFNQTVCPNCGIRSCPKGHILKQSARICPVCGWEDRLFKKANNTTGTSTSRSSKSRYTKPEFTCPQCQRTIDIIYEVCPHCGALFGNIAKNEEPEKKTKGPAGKELKRPPVKQEGTFEEFPVHDMPSTGDYYCKVCKMDSRFISGKCTKCGNLLDTAQYRRSDRKTIDKPREEKKPATPQRKEEVIAKQPAEPFDEIGVYKCPICHATYEKSTDKCSSCGYIGLMDFERQTPKTRKPESQPVEERPATEKGPATEKRPSIEQRPSTEKHPVTGPLLDDSSPDSSMKDLVAGRSSGMSFSEAIMSTLRTWIGSMNKPSTVKTIPDIETGRAEDKPEVEIPEDRVKEWQPMPESPPLEKVSRPEPVQIPVSKPDDWAFPQERVMRRSRSRSRTGLPRTLVTIVVAVIIISLGGYGIYSVINEEGIFSRLFSSTPSTPAEPSTPPATPAPESKSLTIENIEESQITDTGIVINWQTGLPATGQVEYGTTGEYGQRTALNTQLSTEHSVSINGLSPEETYHYRIISTDADGNETTSRTDRMFTTLAPPDTTPPVISGLDVTPMDTSVVIEWTTDEPASGQIEYGRSEELGSILELTGDTTTQHRAVLGGLKPQTTYHFIVKCADAQENETASDSARFTTLAPISIGTNEDDKAPDFTLEMYEGGTVTLSDLQGKLVMVNFWTTGCGACVAEIPDIQAAYDEWSGEKELVVLLVNAKQHLTHVQRFMEDPDHTWLTLPVLLDTDGAVAFEYGITRIPRTFFLDSTGIIREIQHGSFQHAEEILDILATLD